MKITKDVLDTVICSLRRTPEKWTVNRGTAKHITETIRVDDRAGVTEMRIQIKTSDDKAKYDFQYTWQEFDVCWFNGLRVYWAFRKCRKYHKRIENEAAAVKSRATLDKIEAQLNQKDI